jgi:hypothetical protein
MVSIVAFQAVDPGSIPGRRTLFVLFVFLLCGRKQVPRVQGERICAEV